MKICYAGGVFQSKPLLARFKPLVEGESGNRCEPPAHDAACGALLEAYRSAGLTVTLEY